MNHFFVKHCFKAFKREAAKARRYVQRLGTHAPQAPLQKEKNMSAESRFGYRSVSNRGFLLAWAVALSIAAVGCGGGDGGVSPGLTYSGATTQAVITSDNAKTIAASAMDADSGGTGLAEIVGLVVSRRTADEMRHPFPAAVAVVMESAVAKMDRPSTAERLQIPSSAVDSAADIYSVGCGGNYSSKIQSDTDNGVFSGNLIFHAFCQNGITLNGATSFSGIVQISARQVESCTIDFNSFTGTSASASQTMGGQFYFTTTGSTTMTTTDMMVRDNNTGRVCKFENYQMDLAASGTHTETTVNGRYYDPDYGYVDLETTTAFMTQAGAVYPAAGRLVLTGENGASGGPTTARLTALSGSRCRVEADTDGDGLSDYDSGSIPWTDL
jgi:hypothetical protein